MMFKQIKDILQLVQNFHDELHSYYAEINENTKQQKVKILLDSVQNNKDNFSRIVEKLRRSGDDEVLNAWIRHTPDINSKLDFDQIRIGDNLTVDQVVRLVIEFDAWLDHLYRYITETSKSGAVKSLFAGLQENLKMEKMNLVKDANLIKDF